MSRNALFDALQSPYVPPDTDPRSIQSAQQLRAAYDGTPIRLSEYGFWARGPDDANQQANGRGPRQVRYDEPSAPPTTPDQQAWMARLLSAAFAIPMTEDGSDVAIESWCVSSRAAHKRVWPIRFVMLVNGMDRRMCTHTCFSLHLVVRQV